MSERTRAGHRDAAVSERTTGGRPGTIARVGEDGRLLGRRPAARDGRPAPSAPRTRSRTGDGPPG
ncbi:hypothetical protein ACVCAH_28140 [Micromonospora sp. LZ34]